MNLSPVLNPGSAGEAPIHDQVLALVDPEPLPRECLAEVLRAAFSRTLVVAASDLSEINPSMSTSVSLGLMKVLRPYMPGTIGQCVKAFEEHLPGTPVIVMGCGSECFAREAVNAGARGVLPVTDPLRVALAAVRLVLAGGTYYPLRIPSEFLPTADAATGGQGSSSSPLPSPSTSGPSPGTSRGASRSATGDQTVHFTARELDVLAALQRGRSNKWIANHLNLSENTVKVHIRHIMRKLNATNRTQAVIYSQTPSASHRDPGVVPSSASRVPESGL
jgi:DNA-binding NarL/FixJ family response regulator